jgi:polysaccharide chain length determinant protein (PEP-CTERM system associated)
MKFEIPNLTPDFIMSALVRRRWFIMLPLSVALLIGIYYAHTLPRIYEATTLILVEGQRVPENYVQSIVTADPAERINTISQQITSRTNLEKIINDFNLFNNPESANIYMEDKIANLRRRISVDVTRSRRETNAFTISFKGKDPKQVMRVANGLAAYFIEENLKVRESQATGTSEFLESELTTMRRRLEDVEESIKNYRKTNMGELPEQLETNLRILERFQDELSGRQQSLRDAKIRLADLNAQASNREPAVVVIGGDHQQRQEGGATIEELQAQLETLQTRYTDRHPDIQRLKKQIADLQAKADSELTSGSANRSMPTRIPMELRQQMSETKREIELTETEINDIKSQIAVYQQRTENIPKREQELLSLRRDYENIRSTYESLLSRKLEADIAVNMERKQKGEQFRIVDPAREPQRPIEPDMRKVFLFTVAAGLGIGLGVAFLIEVIKPVYQNPDELGFEYELPILASIPQLLQPKQVFLRGLNAVVSIAYGVVIFGLVAVLSYISIIKGA